MNHFYVYAWRRPDTDAIFYIGKGHGKRDRSTHKRNPIFYKIIAKLSKAGLRPAVCRLYENLTEEEAFTIERAEEVRHGRIDNGTGTLANLTDGGEGPSGYVQGYDTRHKRSVSMTGVKKSEEHRANISAGTRGVKKSPIAVANGANARRGAKRSQETLGKMSAARVGKPLADRHREKIGEAQRMAPPVSGKSAVFKGVSYERTRDRYRAIIRPAGKTVHLGRFGSAEEAAKAYDAAASAAWGDDCYLNFPIAK